MRIEYIDLLVRGVSYRLAQVSCGFLVAIVLVTTTDTGMRYLFNNPIGGSNEITEILLSYLIMFAIPYCTAERAHIKVDLLDEFLGDGPRRACNLVNGVIGAVALAYLSHRSFNKALGALEFGDATIFLSFPQWAIFGAISLSAALYVLILTWQTIGSVLGRLPS